MAHQAKWSSIGCLIWMRNSYETHSCYHFCRQCHFILIFKILRKLYKIHVVLETFSYCLFLSRKTRWDEMRQTLQWQPRICLHMSLNGFPNLSPKQCHFSSCFRYHLSHPVDFFQIRNVQFRITVKWCEMMLLSWLKTVIDGTGFKFFLILIVCALSSPKRWAIEAFRPTGVIWVVSREIGNFRPWCGV